MEWSHVVDIASRRSILAGSKVFASRRAKEHQNMMADNKLTLHSQEAPMRPMPAASKSDYKISCLPTEIIEMIFSHILSPRDKLHFRLASKAIEQHTFHMFTRSVTNLVLTPGSASSRRLDLEQRASHASSLHRACEASSRNPEIFSYVAGLQVHVSVFKRAPRRTKDLLDRFPRLTSLSIGQYGAMLCTEEDLQELSIPIVDHSGDLGPQKDRVCVRVLDKLQLDNIVLSATTLRSILQLFPSRTLEILAATRKDGLFDPAHQREWCRIIMDAQFEKLILISWISRRSHLPRDFSHCWFQPQTRLIKTAAAGYQTYKCSRDGTVHALGVEAVKACLVYLVQEAEEHGAA